MNGRYVKNLVKTARWLGMAALLWMGAWGGEAMAAICTTNAGAGLWGTAGTWNCGHVPVAADSVVISRNITAVATTVTGLTVNPGITLTDGGFTVTITGNLTNNGIITGGGNMNVTGAASTLSGNGTYTNSRLYTSGAAPTVAAGAVLNFTGSSRIYTGRTSAGANALTSVLTINGTINSTVATATTTFLRLYANSTIIGSTGVISASVSTARYYNATATLTNNGSVTVQTVTGNSAAGSIWTNAANSTLNVSAAFLTTGTLNASAAGNTVNYSGAAQTIKTPSAAGYRNLTLSGSGIKTMPATVMTVTGNFTLSGTATATARAALTVGGNFSIGATNTFANSTFALNVAGNFAQNGVFTAGAGVVTLNGGAAVQTISGTGALGFANLTVSNTGGITLTRNVTVTSAIIGAVTLTSTCPTDYTLTSNGGATVQHGCATTCFTDTFTGADGAAPGANWSVSSNSGPFGPPVIFNTAGNGRLRLTDATLNDATFAALQRQFPGAGNKIVVDFDHFAYGGTGADGIAVVLSDATILPVPGGYGGSLGYANRGTPTAIDGFAGGWLGVGIDEYGNFSDNLEGRNGGNAAVTIDSVAVRGSGSGQTGYTYHAGTATLVPQVDNNGAAVPPHHYRITVDHSNGINAWVTVERNTGAGYVVLIPAYDAKIKAGQAAVPANWLLSFTGSTGSSTNFHEIDNLSVCATTMAAYTPPAIPGDFNIFDTTTAAGLVDGLIQTKIAGKSFTLDVAALNAAKTAYTTTFTGAVKVELLNSSNNTGVLDTNNCRPTWSVLQALPNATFPATPNSGRLTLAAITEPNAWPDVRMRVSYPATGTPTKIGCSTDNFAIRPNSLANLVLSDTNWTTAGATRVLGNLTADATQGCSAVGTPAGCTAATRVIHKAGQPFSVSAAAQNFASVTTTNYTGTPTAALSACTSAAPSSCIATLGAFSIGAGAAVAGLINSATATYNEVGSFAVQLQDKTFAAVDLSNPSDLTPKDCTAAGGWICSSTLSVGRFVPDHFNVAYNVPTFMPAILDVTHNIDNFTYIGQAFNFDTLAMPGSAPLMTISAMGAGGNVTGNYTAGTVGTTPGVLWKLNNGFINSQAWTDASAVPCATCPLVVNGGAFVVGTSDALTPGTGTAAFSLTSAYYTRPASPVAAFNAALTLSGNLGVDGDAVAAAAPATYQFAAVGFDAGAALATDAQMRYGRVNLSNAHGSELLQLPIAVSAQYWNGSGYVTSVTDSATTLNATTVNSTNWTDITAGNWQKLSASSTWPAGATSVVPATASVALANGVSGFNLAAPGSGNTGSVDMTIPVLTGAGCNAVPTPLGCYLPKSTAVRATFGVYKGSNDFIYLRENY